MAAPLGYTIRAGDTLSTIANGLTACAGVTAQEITQANPSVNPNALAVGAIVNIPARGSGAIVLRYTVMAGDTYSRIAAELNHCANMSPQAIIQANPGINPNALQIGQVIVIPETDTFIAPHPGERPGGGQTAGFWWWAWSSIGTAPGGTTLSIAFSGWADPETAIRQSAPLLKRLPGLKFIAVGGGNLKGAFTKATLAAVTAAIHSGAFSGYDGIAYDVEEGDAGLAPLFQQSFAAAKAMNFKVLVTVSHSAPYGIGDAPALMENLFADANIDYLSPQLYTSGKETANDYATSAGVGWSRYAAANAAVVPSIVNASLYPSAQAYFQAQGVNIAGYVQWSQVST